MKERPLSPHWAWGPELLPAYWARGPLPLPTGKPAGPPGHAWASLSSCLFCGFLKLPAKTAKAKGSTCLSQAKLTCPSTFLYRQKFLPRPCRGQRKWATALYCRSFPISPGLLGLDYETRDANPGHLQDVLVWLPVGAEEEDGNPPCLGRGKTSSPRRCSCASELLDWAPPMAAPVWAEVKAESPIGEKRSRGLGERRTHRGRHVEFSRTMSNGPHFSTRVGEGSEQILHFLARGEGTP